MRKLIVVVSLLLVFTLQACAMITTKSVPMVRVVNVENTSKKELYVRANNWMVDTFNSAKSVVQFTDKESGTISGRYLLGTIVRANEYGPTRNAYASIKIRVKDGAAKITIKPESFTYAEGNIYTLYTKKDVKRDVAALMVSFSTAMKKVEDTNW